jgi:hypothetical protein
MDTPCKQLERWLRSHHPAAPPAELAEHVAGCEDCRGELLLLLAELLEAPIPPNPIDCDECQTWLPTYIDMQLLVGLSDAVRRYPAVWWHLWSCADCATIYQFSLDVVRTRDLEHYAKQIRPLTPATNQPHILLRRQINLFFQPDPALGVALGSSDIGELPPAEELVLMDRPHGEHTLVLKVRGQAEDTWIGVVEMIPPATGLVRIDLGPISAHATFDHSGQALIPDLPLALLLRPDGPDLCLTIDEEI